MQQIYYINSTSLVNNSKPKAWYYQEGIILLDLPQTKAHIILDYDRANFEVY